VWENTVSIRLNRLSSEHA